MKVSKDVNKEMYNLISSFFDGKSITKGDIERIKKMKSKGNRKNEKKSK